jgi:hypothetical protein
MSDIITQLDDFMDSSYRNLWLQDDILTIYVRKSKRIYQGVMVDMIDVANIMTINPEYKKQGYFKRFMERVESFGLPIFVESINHTNTNLLDMLTKNGYEIILNPAMVYNAIKIPQRGYGC